MISIYKTIEDDMVVLDKIEEGCWISAIHPNEEELSFLQEETGIDLDDLRAPLDDEERSRIELEDGYNMIWWTFLRLMRKTGMSRFLLAFI